MKRLLRFFLILAFISGVTTPLSKLGASPVALIGIIVNIALVVLAWKGLNYTLNNTEEQNSSRKAQIIRWLMLLYFSIVAVEIGVLVAFISRFFVDSAVVNGVEAGQEWAIFASKTGFYGELSIIIFPLLVSLPILYFIGKTIGFSKPIIPAVTVFIFWQVLMHLPKLLGM